MMSKRPRPEPAPPADYAALAGTSDAAVKVKTGRDWRRWVEALDAEKASGWEHQRIAEYVHETFGVPGWWAQTVAVGYERIKGLRAIGQRRSGSYEATKSRTFPVPLARLFHAFADEQLRQRWLPDVVLTVRKATPERSLRITWDDGTSVELWFTKKAADRSAVQIQHRKLATKAEAERLKAYWSERLDALTESLAKK
jgi:uncharacterized protein YndB with AHSA1/START domain